MSDDAFGEFGEFNDWPADMPTGDSFDPSAMASPPQAASAPSPPLLPPAAHHAPPPPPQRGAPVAPYAGPPPMLQPMGPYGATPFAPAPGEGHNLGVQLIVLGLGTAGGALLAHQQRGSVTMGSIAGSFAAGAAVNLFRAWSHWRQGTPDGDREAAISGTYGVIAGGLAGFFWWKFVASETRPSRAAVPNPDDGDEDEDEDNDEPPSGRACAIRKATP